MKVLDASVLVEYLTDSDCGAEVRRRIESDSGWVWAPHIVDAEVGNVLRREVRRGRISEQAASETIEDLMEMRLERVSHRLLSERAWELRENLSFYDALYVALAEALEVPLLTIDARLARAPGLRAEVEVIPT